MNVISVVAAVVGDVLLWMIYANMTGKARADPCEEKVRRKKCLKGKNSTWHDRWEDEIIDINLL